MNTYCTKISATAVLSLNKKLVATLKPLIPFIGLCDKTDLKTLLNLGYEISIQMETYCRHWHSTIMAAIAVSMIRMKGNVL